MRLTLDLVPSTCWYSNLRSELPRETWDRLRRESYRAAGYLCEVCGGKGPRHPVECHERWEYLLTPDGRRIQRLAGLISLCPACHEVKHMGRTQIVGRFPQALAHLAAVNRMSLPQARAYVEAEFDLWEERSQYQWELDIDWLVARIDITAPAPPPPPTPLTLAPRLPLTTERPELLDF